VVPVLYYRRNTLDTGTVLPDTGIKTGQARMLGYHTINMAKSITSIIIISTKETPLLVRRKKINTK
jgi:hypothetical protein